MRINDGWNTGDTEPHSDNVKVNLNVGDTASLPEPLKTDHKEMATQLAMKGAEREIELQILAQQLEEQGESEDFFKIFVFEQLAFLQMQLQQIQRALLKNHEQKDKN